VGVNLYQHVGILLALASAVWAQSGTDSAKILKVTVVDDQGSTRIEVTLTAPVASPQVDVANNPDRLSLELPGVVPGNWQTSMNINRDGVKTVQASVDNSQHPPITRVVVDLTVSRPYDVMTDGNTVVLTLLPAPQVAAEAKKRQFANLGVRAGQIGRQ